MNSQNKQDWERKFQQLEVEINPEPIPNSDNKLKIGINRLKQWFNGLNTPARVIVTLIAVVSTFSLLSTVLQLIASLISTAILALILYVLYRTFLASRSSK